MYISHHSAHMQNQKCNLKFSIFTQKTQPWNSLLQRHLLLKKHKTRRLQTHQAWAAYDLQRWSCLVTKMTIVTGM